MKYNKKVKKKNLPIGEPFTDTNCYFHSDDVHFLHLKSYYLFYILLNMSEPLYMYTIFITGATAAIWGIQSEKHVNKKRKVCIISLTFLCNYWTVFIRIFITINWSTRLNAGHLYTYPKRNWKPLKEIKHNTHSESHTCSLSVVKC